MMGTTALTLLALAASASAFDYRPLLNRAYAVNRDLVASPTLSATASQCVDEWMSLLSSLPTPPPEVVSYEETATETNPCSFTVPSSLSSAYSSYESVASSWYTAHSSELTSFFSQCGPSYTDLNYCSTTTGGTGSGSSLTTTAGGTTTTSVSSGSATTSSSSSSSTTSGTASQNAGPRETGLVSVGVLIAGFVGVVAAL